jgi:hypothetical protein
MYLTAISVWVQSCGPESWALREPLALWSRVDFDALADPMPTFKADCLKEYDKPYAILSLVPFIFSHFLLRKFQVFKGKPLTGFLFLVSRFFGW